jgi:protein gp37
MAENSAISWTRHTWNPWMGCTKVSPACDGCYAEALMDKRYGKVGDRPFVFCASLADIFDNQVDPQWRADAFDVMRETPSLVYLLLTKRPQNIVKLSDAVGGLPANAALGATCEDQPRADKNLSALKVAKIELGPLFTFGSFEPLLGEILIPPAIMPDWVITGGETDQGGHKARPTHPKWFRSLRDQAARHGAAYHHKQNGEWVSVSEVDGPGAHFTFDDGTTVRRVGKKLSGREIEGVTHDAFPAVAP